MGTEIKWELAVARAYRWEWEWCRRNPGNWIGNGNADM